LIERVSEHVDCGDGNLVVDLTRQMVDDDKVDWPTTKLVPDYNATCPVSTKRRRTVWRAPPTRKDFGKRRSRSR